MKISFVIPCYSSAITLPNVIQEIVETVGKIEYEIILVNDCSPDDTFDEIRKLSEANKNIIGINFAKNFGQHAALMAGFHHVSGDIVVCMDDDGQTPAEEVLKLVDKIEEGFDVVYAEYPDKKHSLFRNFGSKINTKMTEWLLDKPKGLQITSYFAARRFIIDNMLEYENAYPYVIGLVLRATKSITNVSVKHREREVGKSGYSMRKLLSLWGNGFTSFSVKPLRFASLMGVLIATCGFIYTMVTIVRKIVSPDVPIGWSSIMAVLLLVGGMILLVLGVIGEYIGRIYICINKSPQYVIRESVNYDGK